MPGEDQGADAVRAGRLVPHAHPPLAGFFGEVQEGPHPDLDHRAARRPNILSSFGKEKPRLQSDELDGDEPSDGRFVGFS